MRSSTPSFVVTEVYVLNETEPIRQARRILSNALWMIRPKVIQHGGKIATVVDQSFPSLVECTLIASLQPMRRCRESEMNPDARRSNFSRRRRSARLEGGRFRRVTAPAIVSPAESLEFAIEIPENETTACLPVRMRSTDHQGFCVRRWEFEAV